MKKTIRKNILLSLSLLSLGALAVGGVVWTNNDFVAVNADGVTFSENIEMFNGAKIRTDGPMGIRFGAELTNYSETNGYTYGMIIVPTDYLTTYEVNADYVNAFANYDNGDGTKGVKIAHMTCEVNYGDSDLDGDNEYYIQGSLITLKYENLNRPFTGIGYIKDSAGNYLYTTTNPSRSASYVASAAMLDYASDTESSVYQSCLKYVHGGVNLENEIADETTGYVATSDFAATVGGANALTNGNKDSIALTVGDTQALSITQAPAMGYVVGYSSADKNVATVSADGVITAVATGSTTITVKCTDRTKEIKVHVVTQKFDGVVDPNEYEAGNIFDTLDYSKGLGNTALVYVKSYEEGVALAYVMNNGSNKMYYTSETTAGTSTGNNGAAMEIRMSYETANANTNGLTWRVFADGSIRANKNLTQNPAQTRYTYPTCGASAFAFASMGNNTDGYTQIAFECFIEYEAVGATSAEDCYLAAGVMENSSDKVSRQTIWENSGSADKASANDYKTIAQYEASSAPVLDGAVDTIYTKHLTYIAEDATVKVYWYEDNDAIYLAFDVTATQNRTLTNTGSGNQGSAGISFVYANISDLNDDGYVTTGTFCRAYASGLMRTKAVNADTSDLTPGAPIMNGHLRGSHFVDRGDSVTVEGNTSYVLEWKITCAALGVDSTAEIGFVFGSLRTSGADRFYNRSTSKIDGAWDAKQADTINKANKYTGSNYYWTLADMEAAKVSE